jgi:hypothetical protein
MQLIDWTTAFVAMCVLAFWSSPGGIWWIPAVRKRPGFGLARIR